MVQMWVSVIVWDRFDRKTTMARRPRSASLKARRELVSGAMPPKQILSWNLQGTSTRFSTRSWGARIRVLHQGDFEVRKLMKPGVGVPYFDANCTGLNEVQSISTGAVHWNVNSKDLRMAKPRWGWCHRAFWQSMYPDFFHQNYGFVRISYIIYTLLFLDIYIYINTDGWEVVIQWARATDFSPAGSLVLLRFSLGTYPSSCSRLHHAFFFYLWCHCQLRQEIWSYCWVHIDESHMWLWNWASHVWVRDNFFVKNNQPWLDCSRFRCPLLYFGRIQWKQSKIAHPSKRQYYFNAQVPMSSL